MESCLDTTIGDLIFGTIGFVVIAAVLFSFWVGASGRLGSDHRFFAWLVLGYFAMSLLFTGSDIRVFGAFSPFSMGLVLAAVYSLITLGRLQSGR